MIDNLKKRKSNIQGKILNLFVFTYIHMLESCCQYQKKPDLSHNILIINYGILTYDVICIFSINRFLLPVYACVWQKV